MKLHLPKGLRAALLACMGLLAPLSTTLSMADEVAYSGTIYTWKNTGTSTADLAYGAWAASTLQADGTYTYDADITTWDPNVKSILATNNETDRNTIRFDKTVGSNGSLKYTFGPLAIAGIIVESGTTGYTLSAPSTGSNRSVYIGNDNTTAAFSTIHESFSISNEASTNTNTGIFLRGTQTITIDTDKTLTLTAGSHTISVSGDLTVSGGGTLALSGNVTNSAALNIAASSAVSISGSINTKTINNSGSITISDATSVVLDSLLPPLSVGAGETTTGLKTATGGTFTLSDGDGTVTLGNNLTYTYKGLNATVAWDSDNKAGTATVSGLSYYYIAGTDTVTYSVANADTPAWITVSENATLSELTGTISTEINGSGTISMAAGAGEVNISADKLTEFSGSLVINSGRFNEVNNGHVFSNVTVNNGGQFYIQDNYKYSGNISINGTGWNDSGDDAKAGALRIGGNSVLSGNLTLLGDSSIIAHANSGTISGDVTGQYKLTINGDTSGSLTLSGNVNVGALSSSVGKLFINGTVTVSSTETQTIANLVGNTVDGTLSGGSYTVQGFDFSNSNTTAAALNLRGGVAVNVTDTTLWFKSGASINIEQDSTFSHGNFSITGIEENNNAIVTGSANSNYGASILSNASASVQNGAITYTGTEAGTLAAALTNCSVTSNQNLSLTAVDTLTTLTATDKAVSMVGGSISGAVTTGSFVKSGSDALTMHGSVTTGNIEVNGGALNLGNVVGPGVSSQDISVGDVTVAGGSTFSVGYTKGSINSVELAENAVLRYYDNQTAEITTPADTTTIGELKVAGASSLQNEWKGTLNVTKLTGSGNFSVTKAQHEAGNQFYLNIGLIKDFSGTLVFSDHNEFYLSLGQAAITNGTADALKFNGKTTTLTGKLSISDGSTVTNTAAGVDSEVKLGISGSVGISGEGSKFINDGFTYSATGTTEALISGNGQSSLKLWSGSVTIEDATMEKASGDKGIGIVLDNVTLVLHDSTTTLRVNEDGAKTQTVTGVTLDSGAVLEIANSSASVSGVQGAGSLRASATPASSVGLSDTFSGDLEASNGATLKATGAASLSTLKANGGSIELLGVAGEVNVGSISVSTGQSVSLAGAGSSAAGTLKVTGNVSGEGSLISTGDISITGSAQAGTINTGGNLTLSGGGTIGSVNVGGTTLALGGTLTADNITGQVTTLDLSGVSFSDPLSPLVSVSGNTSDTLRSFTLSESGLNQLATIMAAPTATSYTLLECTSLSDSDAFTLNGGSKYTIDNVGTFTLSSQAGTGVLLTFTMAPNEWVSTDGQWTDTSGFSRNPVEELGMALFSGNGTSDVNIATDDNPKKIGSLVVNTTDGITTYTLKGNALEAQYASVTNGTLNVENSFEVTSTFTVTAPGVLQVQNDGHLTSAKVENAGTVNVSGGQANVQNFNNVTNGQLVVSGGKLLANTLNNGAIFELNDGTAEVGKLDNEKTVTVTNGELKVTTSLTNSGDIQISGGAASIAALDNLRQMDSVGTLTVSGGELNVSGTLTNAGEMTVSGGKVTLANLENNGPGTLSLQGGNTALTAASNSGTLTVKDGAQLTFDALTNAGTMTVDAKGEVTAETSTLTNTGTMKVKNGGKVTVLSYDDRADTADTIIEEGGIFTVLDGKVGDKALAQNAGTIDLETLNDTTTDTTLSGMVLVHGESLTPFSGSYAEGVKVGTTKTGDSVGNLVLNAGENLTVIGEVGHITVTGMRNAAPAANKLGSIATTGADVTLDNSDGASATTVTLGSESSMVGGELEFTVSAAQVNANLAANKADKPTVTTNAALHLTDVTLKVKEVENTGLVRTPGGPEQNIILFVVSDHEASTVSGVELDLSGCSWMTKYFTNFRVEQGSVNVVADANTGVYSRHGITPNGTAGLALAGKAMFHLAPQDLTPDSELAQVLDMLDNHIATGNTGAMDRLGAALAGSSLSAVGLALADDVQRQLRSIRNRTTTMGVNECVVNEDMPYVNGWISGDGNYRQLSESGTDAGYELSSWGGTVGVDVDVNPNLTLGVAVSALFGDYTGKAADTLTGDLDTQYVSLFARVSTGSWVNTFVGTLGRADVDLERTIPGVTGKTTYKTNGMMFGFLYEVARTFALNEDASTCVQPLFNMSFSHTSLDSATEGGTADTRLTTDSASLTQFSLGLGGRLQSIVGENEYNRASIFEARALLKLDLGDRYNKLNTALAALPTATVTTRSNEKGVIGAEVGASLTIPLSQDAGSIFFDVNADFNADEVGVNGSVGYRVNF